MFTVKIVRPDDELLIEASEVTKEPNGILVQTANDTEFYGSHGSRLALDAGCRTGDNSPQTGGTAQAYVMNRFGATVATYRL